jgi:hypothetical protein
MPFPILEKQFVFSCKVETSLVDSELAVIVRSSGALMVEV